MTITFPPTPLSDDSTPGEILWRKLMRFSAKSNQWRTFGWVHRATTTSAWLALGLCVVLATSTSVFGQAPAKKVLSEEKMLPTKDNANVAITYFKATGGQDAPVVILLHGKGSSRQVWKGYAEFLQKADFAVVTVDLRGHGESTGGGGAAATGKKAETGAPKAHAYEAMVAGDMEAVKNFLREEHQKKQLNMNKLAIVAADMSTPVAIAYTELDWKKTPYDDAPTLAQKTPRGQDVQALILLSPEGTAPGLNVTKSVGFIRVIGRAVMIGVGNKNKTDLIVANKMHDQLDPKKEKDKKEKDKEEKDKDQIIYIERYESPLEGTNLLNKNLGVEKHMFAFLTKHLKDHKSEWRDRRSKLDL